MSRVALVTGGARRIGAAVARVLARDGYAVAVHYQHSAAEAEALVQELLASGGGAAALRADLADREASHGLVARCQRALGTVSVLVTSTRDAGNKGSSAGDGDCFFKNT